MIEIFFLCLIGVAVIYAIFFWFYSSFKKEKDFANDVYGYLRRRYVNTSIVDYGGISSDPIILSHYAGPFKLLEVKVITVNGKDKDLIIRGEVDPLKFEAGELNPANLFITLKHLGQGYSRYSRNVPIGEPGFDNRFHVDSDDPLFVRHLLTRTNLGNMIKRNFDLEGYSIRWLQYKNPVVQIRMETMSSNSFIQGFNILLGTIGTLSEKGYLIRVSGEEKQEDYQVPVYEPSRKLKEIPAYKDEPFTVNHEPIFTDYQVLNEKNNELKQEKYIIDTEKKIADFTVTINHQTEITPEVTPLEKENQHLFDSIRYQVKDIVFQESQIIIRTFSTSNEEIIVRFPSNINAQFSTLIKKQIKSDFSLQINFLKDSYITNWDDVWKDIEITGSPEIINAMKMNSTLTNRITSTRYMKFNAIGSIGDGINCELLVKKTREGINTGYSLLKDFIWFFDMFYF